MRYYSREYVATWIGVIGIVLLSLSGIGFFLTAEYLGAIVLGSIGTLLLLAGLFLLRQSS